MGVLGLVSCTQVRVEGGRSVRGQACSRRRRVEVRAGLGVAGRYGWHRDELYYAVAGLHLQGGYVEFPPVTALPATLARAFGGYWSVFAYSHPRKR